MHKHQKQTLHTPCPQEDMASSVLQFRVDCRRTKPGQAVYIVGSAPELGAWKVEEGTKGLTDVCIIRGKHPTCNILQLLVLVLMS